MISGKYIYSNAIKVNITINSFLLSGVSIDGNFIKGRLTDSEREQLENIGDSKQFILESFGNKAMYLYESTSENLTVLTFS